jgi:hypothetical protein
MRYAYVWAVAVRINGGIRVTLVAGFRALPQVTHLDFVIILWLIQMRSTSSPINQFVSHRAPYTALRSVRRGALHTVQNNGSRQTLFTRNLLRRRGSFREVSNNIWNAGVKISTPSTWLVTITVMHCFETSSIATLWHGAKSTAVTAMTSQSVVM